MRSIDHSRAEPEGPLDLLLRVALDALPVLGAAVLAEDEGDLAVAAARGFAEAALRTAAATLRGHPALAEAWRHGSGCVDLGPLAGSGRLSAFPIRGSARAGVLLALRRPDQTRLPQRAAERLADTARLAASLMPGKPGAENSEAEARLEAVIDALPQAVAVFDASDRFVLWNRLFAQVYSSPAAPLRRGLAFERHLEACALSGLVPAPHGREAEWVAERMARYRRAEGGHDHQLSSGRWVRVEDRRIAGGGRIGVRSDITDIVAREQAFRRVFEANPAPMLVIDRDTLAFLAVNDAAVAFYGHARADFLRLHLPDIRPEGQPGEIEAMIARIGDPSLGEVPRLHRTAAGEDRIVKVGACFVDWGGREAILASVFDMTERYRMEEDLRSARAFLKRVVDHVPTAVFAKDLWHDGRYVIFNRAGETLFGRRSGDAIGQPDHHVFDPDEAAVFEEQDSEAMRLGSGGAIDDAVIRRPDGSTRVVRTRRVVIPDGPDLSPRYILGVAEDVTEQRRHEARMTHLAHHDALTDLANRILFHDRLEMALARAAAADEAIAVLYLDLDGFKAVNDGCGHATGDMLLRIVGERLRHTLRGSDLAARLGGDEFAVLQAPIGQAAQAEWLARRLVTALAAPYVIEGRELRISTSVGIAIAPTHGLAPQALMAAADEALYRAKREGRNRYCFAATDGCILPSDPPRTRAAAPVAVP